MRNWDEFTGGPNRPSEERVHVTLSKTGNLLLNKKAYEVLGSPEAAVLLYDRRYSMIGVRPATLESEHAFPLCQKSNAKHRLIRAMPFCRHHKLIVKRTISFPDAVIEEDGAMALDLHTAVEVGRFKG